MSVTWNDISRVADRCEDFNEFGKRLAVEALVDQGHMGRDEAERRLGVF